MDAEPLVVFPPVHAPEAVQAVALVEDHISVEVLPLVTELGLALRLTVGAGCLTLTVAD